MKKTFSKYGLIGCIRLIRDVLITRVMFGKCRLVRWPFYIRGKKHIDFGSNLTLGVNVRIDAFPENKEASSIINFGSNCQMNDYVHIGAVNSIKIGDDVLIASKVFITDHNHGSFPNEPEFDLPPQKRSLSSKEVVIEDRVWLGESFSIMPGVTIGKNSVIP